MLDMIINNNYNSINFGQKIPTYSFLKMGSGIFSFEDAKNLCQAFDKEFPGHIGYYKHALHYVDVIEHKNPELRDVLIHITSFKDKHRKLEEIAKLAKKFGEEIDVVI